MVKVEITRQQKKKINSIRSWLENKKSAKACCWLLCILFYSFLLSAFEDAVLDYIPNDTYTSFNPMLAFGTPEDKTSEKTSRYQTSILAKNLKIPWTMDFAPDGRIFLTEREGDLRVILPNGTLLDKPIASFKVGGGEGGLLGMELDPNFEKNHYIYLYYTYSELVFSNHNRVVRFTEKNNQLSDEKILIDKIPAAAIHDGGRIAFGPDGKLYITTGDAANAPAAQNPDSLSGKILRINSDGTIPEDNPFGGDSPVYSMGHRNPQGMDWDPNTGKLIISEHGPSGDRGAFAHDEVNVVEEGKNYGWPEVIGDGNNPKYVDPLIHTGDVTWAPSGATFYTGDRYPDLKDKYLIATLRGVHLRVLDLDVENDKVLSSNSLFTGNFGRLRDVVQGPDGYLYMLTSNRDGRGSPVPEDDRIVKLLPKTHKTEYTIAEEGKSIAVVIESPSHDVAEDLNVSLDKKNRILGLEFNQFVLLDKASAGTSIEATFSKELLGGPYEISFGTDQGNTENNILTKDFVRLHENNTHTTVMVKNLVSVSKSDTIKDKVVKYSNLNVHGNTVIPEFNEYRVAILVAGLAGVVLFMVFVKSKSRSFLHKQIMQVKE